MPITTVKIPKATLYKGRLTINEGLEAKAYSRVLDISDARIRW